jgi:hypothetical protein
VGGAALFVATFAVGAADFTLHIAHGPGTSTRPARRLRPPLRKVRSPPRGV